MTVPRLVLDTNVWLDLLVFRDPGVEFLRNRRADIVIDAACEEELRRVLGYPFRKQVLEPARQAELLAEMGALCTRFEGAASDTPLPRCKDPDDQKFLELAAACGASHLVTKDEALLCLARRVAGFRIVKPAGLS